MVINRSASIDRFKGLLIALVVIGHAIGGGFHLFNADNAKIYQLLFKVIYSFHMPAFFFVAGVLYKERTDFWSFAKRRAQRLLIPYFVFGVLTAIMYSIVASRVMPDSAYYENKTGGSLLGAAIELLYGGPYKVGMPYFVFNSVLWFLPTMFSLEMVYYALDKLRKNLSIRHVVFDLGVGMLGLVLGWFVRPETIFPLPWGLKMVPYYLFYFCFGRVVPYFTIESVVAKMKMERFAWLLPTLLLTVACFCTPDLIFANLRFGWYLVFSGMALLGTSSAVFLSYALRWRVWVLCGIASLAIMLIHKPILIAMQFVCPPIRAAYGKGVLLGLVATLMVSVVATTICLVANAVIVRYLPWALGDLEGKSKKGDNK